MLMTGVVVGVAAAVAVCGIISIEISLLTKITGW
jgi:hypothetical protein